MLQQQQSWFGYLKDRKLGVYFEMRLRIGLRKKGLIPSGDKVTDDNLVKKAASHGLGIEVNDADIQRALYEGHEVSNKSMG